MLLTYTEDFEDIIDICNEKSDHDYGAENDVEMEEEDGGR